MFEKWKEILLGSEDEQNSTQSLEHNAHAWSVLFCLQRSLFCLQRSLFCLQRSLFCLQRSLFCLKRSLFCLQHFFFFNVHLFVCRHVFHLQRSLFFFAAIVFSLQRFFFSAASPLWAIVPFRWFGPPNCSTNLTWIPLNWFIRAVNFGSLQYPSSSSWAFPSIAFLCNVF